MTAIQESDLALVQRARAGDASAFGTLYERHHDRVQRIVRKFVWNDEASDIVHDAFVKAIERLHNAWEDTDFRAWIGQVAARTALDYVRSAHAGKSRPGGLPSPDIFEGPQSLLTHKLSRNRDPEPTPEEALLAKEQATLLDELLDGLRPWEQEALRLHAWGHELRDIARHQVRPYSSLKPALFRVRADLARRMVADPERYGPLNTERAARSLNKKLSAYVPRRPTAPDVPLPEGDSQ